MARLNDDAQWIVLMGFMVSFSLIFLGIVINQSTLVGQTTAEGVLEFPKNDILNVRSAILQSSTLQSSQITPLSLTDVHDDIISIAMSRKNAIVSYRVKCQELLDPNCVSKIIDIHYNNGVTAYNETANY